MAFTLRARAVKQVRQSCDWMSIRSQPVKHWNVTVTMKGIEQSGRHSFAVDRVVHASDRFGRPAQVLWIRDYAPHLSDADDLRTKFLGSLANQPRALGASFADQTNAPVLQRQPPLPAITSLNQQGHRKDGDRLGISSPIGGGHSGNEARIHRQEHHDTGERGQRRARDASMS